MTSLDPPLASIIIVNYNGERFLNRCLKSVLETDYPNFEVILVDNGSSDAGIRQLGSKFANNKRLRIIKNKVNVGWAGGNDIGISCARGEYLVFLNNDTEVDDRWIWELVKVMDSDDSIGAAQSKLLLMDHPTRYDCAGGFLDYYGTTHVRGNFEKDVGQYQEIDEIFTCKGASMIVRRRVIDKVGLFDPTYIFSYDDTDLCWRIWLAGYRIVFVPSSVVYHKGGGTAPQEGPRYVFFEAYLDNRNRIMTLLKNYEMRNLGRYLIPWIMLEIQRIILMGLKGYKPLNALYSLNSAKAILWNLVHIDYVWEKRLYVQNIVRSLPDAEVMPKMKLKKMSEKIDG